MYNTLTALLTELEKTDQEDRVKDMIDLLIPISISLKMVEISVEDAISDYEVSVSRVVKKEEKKAIEFGFMCGLCST